MTPLQILQNQFGYSAFRLEQERIINAVLQQQDTFALMPTGGGKSLCYQIPALMFDGLTLVISPLIALMKDQVDALRVNGIEAAYLNSTQSYQEQDLIIDKARNKKLKLLYLAPERLIKYDREANNKETSVSALTRSTLMNTLLSMEISLIAIDEAHCISHWGHDFRPEYLMLAELKRALPGVPVIALTATADKLTRKDIVEKLALKDPAVFVSSFNRANIRYTVEAKRNSFQKLLDFLSTRKEESGIIYCLSRGSTEKLASDLQGEGFQALAYHAGMEKEKRAKHQELFLKDDVRIIVATIAFGMGINKSNVRYVVHMDLPKNIEGYYQETGRAGRDGLDSEALLFFSYGDVSKLKHFASVEGNEEQTRIALQKLDQMADYGELTTCRRKYLLNYFDEKAADYCGSCDVCLTTVELYDGTVPAQKVLSAVSRLQERFGAGYVIDFLRGSNSAKIQEDHKTLKTYGIGADMTKDAWSAIIHDLVDRGYLAKTKGMYPVLTLSEKSSNVLKGIEKVMLTKSKERLSVYGDSDQSNYEAALLQQLKDVRRKLASEENVPAYIVLSDATLIEIATYLPHDKDAFRKISGFGEVKIEKYGKQFWEVVAAYCTEYKLTSRIHLKVPKRIRKERSARDSDTKQETLDLYRQGYPLEEIAKQRNLTKSTIEGHLAFYIQEGTISIDQFLGAEKIKAIQQAIASTPGTALGPIKSLLGDAYSYGEIRMVMAHMEKESITR